MDDIVVMCEASTHLNWELQEGDRYYVKNNLYEGDNDNWTTIKPVVPEGWGRDIYPDIEIGYKHIRNVDEFGVYECNGDWLWSDEEGLKRQSIWVPYQHQLQELLLKFSFYTTAEMVDEFIKFIYKRDFGIPINQEHTMDELWLLFFHYHLHSEFWDGSEWIKVEKTRSFWGG